MDDKIEHTTTLVDKLCLREPDPARQLIDSFLIARSEIFRGLAELRDEVSEPLTRLNCYTTLLHNWKPRLITFARDGATRKATSTSKSSGKPRMKRLSGSEESFTI